MAQRAMPHISGFLRPKVSLKGPKKSCPTAIPTIVVVIVSCTIGAEAWSSPVREGKDGKYISMQKGAIAVSMPRKKMNSLESFEPCV